MTDGSIYYGPTFTITYKNGTCEEAIIYLYGINSLKLTFMDPSITIYSFP